MTPITSAYHPHIHMIYCLKLTHFITLSRCPTGWTGYRCEVPATPVDSSSTSGGSKSQSSRQAVILRNPALRFSSLTLFDPSQTLPPSSSRFSCCWWRPWWSAPSGGTSGECAGESSSLRVLGFYPNSISHPVLAPLLSSFSFSLTF